MANFNQKIDKELERQLKYITPKNKNLLKELPILLIDDDKWILKILKKFLERWGFMVTMADNPVDGIVLALENRPLLIFLDILMPDVKGDTLLKMLKKIEFTSNVPVIILSGNLSKDILGSAFKNGANGFISKPFTEELLLEKLKAVFGEQIIDFLNIDNENDDTSYIVDRDN